MAPVLARRARQQVQQEQIISSGLQISSQLSEHGPSGITFLVIEFEEFEVFTTSSPQIVDCCNLARKIQFKQSFFLIITCVCVPHTLKGPQRGCGL